MIFKVELRPQVVRFIRYYCTDGEVDAFYKAIRKLSEDPIDLSEPVQEPRLSRYMLRFFRFAGILAIFRLNLAEQRIRVLECRRIPSRRRGNPEPPTGDQPP